MGTRRHHAAFLTSAVIIAVPLAILSTVALYSLRHDKASIEQDARERAEILASELARQCGEYAAKRLAELSTSQLVEFEATAVSQSPNDFPEGLPQLHCWIINGRIRSPVDYPRVPTPPDWPSGLTSNQLSLWRNAETRYHRQRATGARDVTAALMAVRLPESVLANAEYNLVLSEAHDAGARAAERLGALARRYPYALTEAGTPLADLALIRALRLSTSGQLPEGLPAELSRRISSQPSLMTPELLKAWSEVAERTGGIQLVQGLKKRWLAQEKARGLLHLLIQNEVPRTQSQIWLESDGESFLALCRPMASRAEASSGSQVTLMPWPLVQQIFLDALARSRVEIPAYAAPVLQVGNRRLSLRSASHSTDPVGDPRLASAPGHLEIRAEFSTLSLGAFKDDLTNLVPTLIPDQSRTTSEPVRHSGAAASYPFRIELELAHQGLLYARYRRRLWLSAGVVLLAAAAAGIGLVIAWRAFQRQLALSEMTSNFISSVSHEFRAPLASVRLMAESLDRGRITGSKKRSEYFRLILEECRRLSSLVENVLDFTRIDQGRRQYEFEHFDLMAMVRQTIGLMEPTAAERRVTFILEDPPSGDGELQPCWDAQAVQQALINLLDNAIKHTSAGGVVTITLTRSQVSGGGTSDKVLLSVQDQGPGIPASDIERIFEPFYRSGSELRRETKGIGIGLSIVKHVAEAHHGRVLVNTSMGKGTCFTLELPLSVSP